VARRNPFLYRLARWAVHIKNLGNPLYWAGKELSREGYFFTLRWFHVVYIGQVGREAMRVYSGRTFQKEEDRDATLVCYRLFALTRRWGGPSPAEWAALVDFISGHGEIETKSSSMYCPEWLEIGFPKTSTLKDCKPGSAGNGIGRA